MRILTEEQKEKAKMRSKRFYAKNKEEQQKKMKLNYQRNKKHRLEYRQQYYNENKDACSKQMKKYWENNKHKLLLKGRLEGRSSPSLSLELQFAMNRVRLRDNNTCQWYGCGLQHKITEVHVHHIFPRSEYPELELIESYMICYCAEHHAQFHAARGDHYHKLIRDKRKIIINDERLCNVFEKLGESD